MIKSILIAALSLLLSVDGKCSLTIKKWNFQSHTYNYVGTYRCTCRGEVKFFTNAEMNFWRVAHYNGHQEFDNYTRLLVLVDGAYVYAHSIESQGIGAIRFQSNIAMQRFLAQLTD